MKNTGENTENIKEIEFFKDSFDGDYDIEEADDERTIMSQIIRYAETVTYKRELAPEEITELEERATKMIPYYADLKAIIDASGMVSYYWNMKHGIKGNVQQMKIIASAYQHDASYYQKMLDEWRWKARRSLATFKVKANVLGVPVNPEKEYQRGIEWDNGFLNQLAISEDRRKCYKDYIFSYSLKAEVLSVDELEKFYQRRLTRRAKRATKKKSSK